jgi:hypothetical protein
MHARKRRWRVCWPDCATQGVLYGSSLIGCSCVGAAWWHDEIIALVLHAVLEEPGLQWAGKLGRASGALLAWAGPRVPSWTNRDCLHCCRFLISCCRAWVRNNNSPAAPWTCLKALIASCLSQLSSQQNSLLRCLLQRQTLRFCPAQRSFAAVSCQLCPELPANCPPFANRRLFLHRAPPPLVDVTAFATLPHPTTSPPNPTLLTRSSR